MQIEAIQDRLSVDDVVSIVPNADDDAVLSVTKEQFEIYKRQISFRYLKKIRSPKTWAILVVNPKKYEIDNYIGPNTFAEIAIAFTQRKKIFLLNDIPNVYMDELVSWRAVSLHGSLSRLVSDYHRSCKINIQPRLF
ncbi:MAG: hypothetical protein L6406_08385 [Desulfobacterales bacterium]|nr:hypothetical protein [Desulfobacterales bacterium]